MVQGHTNNLFKGFHAVSAYLAHPLQSTKKWTRKDYS